MTDGSSASLLFICRSKDFCLSQIAACLSDPQVSTEETVKKLLLAAALPKTEAKFTLPQNDPDLLLIDPSQQSLGIAEIRQIRWQIQTKPQHRKTKIVILAQAEKLTVEAQNALLKTLEEPPDNTVLILIAFDANLLLKTVTSRCRIINLPSPAKNLTPSENDQAWKVLDLMEKPSVTEGFSWAKAMATKRPEVQREVEKLLIVSHQNFLEGKISPRVLRKLFQAQKYLAANTNVRLTLENLFLN